MSTRDDHGGGDAGGAQARAQTLLDGIVGRLGGPGAPSVARERDGTWLRVDGRGAARLVAREGVVVAEVDPRAGAGDPAALRRIGHPHPDRARSAQGWRRFVVRTRADAARLVRALRAPREPREGPPPPSGMLVGRVRVRRLSDPPDPRDGTRVLVDEAWPRGVEREGAPVDAWEPEAAPSRPLRAAYGAVPGVHRGFRRAYLAELRGGTKADVVTRLRRILRDGPLTLLTGVRDLPHAAAVVLAHAVTHGRTPKA